MAKLLKDYLKEYCPKVGMNPELEFKNAVKRYGEDTANKAMVFDSMIEIETKELDEDEPIVDVTVEIPDRSREVMLVSGAKLANYRKNPIMLSGHRYAPEFTIGGARWIKPGKTNWKGKEVNSLKAKTWFASTPFSQDHKTLIKEGALRAFSHTFVPLEFVDDEDSIKELGFKPKNVNRIYTDYEILEFGPVTIPDNPAALVAQKSVVESDYFKDMIRGYEGDNEDETEVKSAIPYKKFPLTPEGHKWDAGTARKRIADWASNQEGVIDFKKYIQAFCWYVSEKPDNVTSYKFPIADIIDGKLNVAWRAVANAMARLGSSDIPEEDKKKVHNKLAKYYKDFDKEPPPYKSLTEFMETDLIWVEINAMKAELIEMKAIAKGKKGQEWNESSSGDLPEKEIVKVIADKLSDVLKFGMEELNKQEEKS